MQKIYKIMGKIKTENRRLTAARVGILKALMQAEDKPLSDKDLKKWLRKNRIRVDRTTVWRQLKYLISKNYISRFQLESGKVYYELAGEHHHHLICIRCKKIANIQLDSVEKDLAVVDKDKNFRVLGHTLELYGLCRACARH